MKTRVQQFPFQSGNLGRTFWVWVGFWVCVLVGKALQAQSPLAMNRNDEGGLPTNEVYQMAQDEFGYVWLATQSGLYKYDGIRTQGVRGPGTGTTAMVNVWIDQEGRVWTRTGAGALFRVQEDSLHLVRDLDPAFPLQGIVPHPSGDFLILGADSILWMASDGHTRKMFPLPPHSGPSLQVGQGLCTHQTLQFALNSIWYSLDLSSGRYQTLFESGLTQFSGWVENGEGEWAFFRRVNEGEGKLFHQEKGKWVEKWSGGDPQDRWHRVYRMPEGTFWICTTHGAFSLRPQQGHWFQGPKIFPKAAISSFLVDQEGIQWFSSLDKGIFLIPNPEVVQFLPPGAEQEDWVCTQVVRLPNGPIVVGTSKGKIWEVTATGLEKRLEWQDERIRYSVKAIQPVGGEVWIARGPTEITDPALQRAQLTKYSNLRDFVAVGDSIFGILSDRAIVFSIDDARKGKDRYRILAMKGGRQLVSDPKKGWVYFALDEGTYVWDGIHLEPVRVQGETLRANMLQWDGQRVLAYQPEVGIVTLEGNLATHWMRVPLWQGETFRAFGAGPGGIWAATERKLLHWASPSSQPSVFSGSIGLQPHTIQAFFLDSAWTWVATAKGLVRLPAQFSPRDTFSPPIRIRGLWVDGSPRGKDGVLRVHGSEKNIRIEFEGISFRSNGNFGFEYRLLGSDSTWIRTEASVPFVQFPSLSPGNYTFQVRTVTGSGIRSLKPATLGLHVATPFFQSWLFIAILILVAILLSLAIFLWRLRIIRKKHLIQQKLIASQLTALKAQINPHFLFNALNSIQDLILSQDIRGSNLYLNKFSTLVRKVLDHSSHNDIRLSDEIEMLTLYLELEHLRFGDSFQFSIQNSADLDPDDLRIPSLVLQPFVENALKHGLLHKKGPKQLLISFSQDANGIHCVIQDNGIGRSRAAEIQQRTPKKHTSFATQATERRLDLIQQLFGAPAHLSITDLFDNGSPSGTRVEVTFPFLGSPTLALLS